jgi:glycerol-3-phosphate O-acyltransferase
MSFPNVIGGEPVLIEVERRVVARLLAPDARGGSDATRTPDLLIPLVDRYAREIAGRFDPRVYRVATRLVPPALSALLHGLSWRDPRIFDVEDSIRVAGETDALRAVVRKGTVILAPTHVSNLDSLVMGSVINRLGLPPFAYAAGLNLYSNAIVGFFLRHLGAYTVDRQKSDPIYRETLKEYATVLLEQGQHTLLFPGGTRSRSGAVETHLKKGLLGTAPIAFRHALEAGAARPRIYIVPCTLTYPLVLEASAMIEDHLRSAGHPPEESGRSGEYDQPRQWLRFLRGLRHLNEHVHVRFSRPLDCLGNEVDIGGASHDRNGPEIDPAQGLMANGRLVEDAARDASTTRTLAERIVEAYRRDNLALPTSVVAFALGSLGARAEAAEDEVRRVVARALHDLARLERAGAVHLAPELRDLDPSGVIDLALATFATYHALPVIERRGDCLHVGDPNLLLYYRNRLQGYGILGEANAGE